MLLMHCRKKPVCRRAAAPCVGAVNHIVVNESGSVKKLQAAGGIEYCPELQGDVSIER
jgi:hypothetical protein